MAADQLDNRLWHNIVILTGAGISAESGLGTFRGAGGLWEQQRVEDVATPEAFARDPELVYRFYNARREHLCSGEVQPNTAHAALAELEQAFAGNLTIVTQNVDDLHERGGSRRLYHMHGELMKMRCQRSGAIYDAPAYFDAEDTCECCGQQGQLRPHVVWFGEMPLEMDAIYSALEACHLFLSIGTSGNVYPAAGFVAHVRRFTTAHTMEINMEPSAGAT
ncbi:MAG: NAD-dependent deacylase, partial [Halieaceae bacterium]|nr:NAD-dependent deacylase [Halieaceae bacterium]